MKIIKRLVPEYALSRMKLLREEVGIAREFGADWLAYRRVASHDDAHYIQNTTSMQLETQITKDYHRIEKGLALSAPKRPFGKEVSERLRTLLPIAYANGERGRHIGYAEEALAALEKWNLDGVVDESISPVYRAEQSHLSREDLSGFFSTRKSVRHFSPELPAKETLEEAIRLASYTPSVCNRQSARIHLYTTPTKVSSVLAHQNGNAAFRDEVPIVAIVTTDRRLFSGKSERNQRWIDGALFAMSFVWALHGLGIASCMLNWSMTNQQTRDMRCAASIPPWEDVIMLIACGKSGEGHRYARSPRRTQKGVALFH